MQVQAAPHENDIEVRSEADDSESIREQLRDHRRAGRFSSKQTRSQNPMERFAHPDVTSLRTRAGACI